MKSPSEKNDFQQGKTSWPVVNNLQETVRGVRDRELLVKNLQNALAQEAEKYRQL